MNRSIPCLVTISLWAGIAFPADPAELRLVNRLEHQGTAASVEAGTSVDLATVRAIVTEDLDPFRQHVLDRQLVKMWPSSALRDIQDEVVGLGATSESRRAALNPFVAALEPADPAEVIESQSIPFKQQHDQLQAASGRSDAVEFLRNLDPEPGSVESAWVGLTLGYHSIAQGARADAELLWQKAALTDDPAARSVANEALMRLGFVRHSRGLREDAFEAFEALRMRSEVGTAIHSQALLQLSGLAFELCKHHEIGTYADVRAFIDDALAQVPQSHVHTRSTLSLMHLETYYYEGEYESCIAATHSFLESSQFAAPRDKATALLFLGAALHYSGDRAGAEEVFRLASEYELLEHEHWGAIPNLNRRALELQLEIARLENDWARVNRFSAQLREFDEHLTLKESQ